MTLTLEEAIIQRLEDRKEDIEKRTEARRQLAALTRSEVDEAFRDWVQQATDIVLPDEVWTYVSQVGNSPSGRRRFDISIHFTGEPGTPGRPYVQMDTPFEYDAGALMPIFAANWRGNPLQGLPQSFGEFIDAVIYTLGGAERLAKGRIMPIESEAVHVFG